MKKIVIQVQDMGTDKCRSKVMKIAAVCRGVESVAIEGESKDQVVVTGVNIDSVCLTHHIRKKFRSANIISVEDVKKDNEEEKKPEEEEQKPEEEETKIEPIIYCDGYYPPSYPTYYVYDPYPPKSCFFF